MAIQQGHSARRGDQIHIALCEPFTHQIDLTERINSTTVTLATRVHRSRFFRILLGTSDYSLFLPLPIRKRALSRPRLLWP